MAPASKRYTIDKTSGTPRCDPKYPHHPPCGVRIFTDGQTPDSTSGWLNDAIAVPTLAIYTSWLHILLALFIASFFWRPAAIAFGVLFATTLLPARPLWWRAFLQSHLLTCWRRYFHFSFYFEEDLDDATDHLFAMFPHGAFPLGSMLGGASMACEFPNYRIYSLAATSVFFTPLWRHIIGWMGGVPATRKHFRRLMAMTAPKETAAKDTAARGAGASVAGTTRAAGPAAAGLALGAADEASKSAAGVVNAAATPAAAAPATSAKTAATPAGQAADAAVTAEQSSESAATGAAVGSDRADIADEAGTDAANAETMQELPPAAAAGGKAVAAASTLPNGHKGVRQRLWHARPKQHSHSSVDGSSLRRVTAVREAGAGTAQQNKQQRQEQQAQHQDSGPANGSSRQGMGIGVIVGGIAEMFILSPDHDAIYLHNRKGFVALALEAGIDICPVYSFGNTALLSYRAPKWLADACRRLGVSAGLIYGRWGLIIPRKLPVMFVLGRIVKVGAPMARNDPGFSARVQELHGQVVDEVVRLYDAHRAKFGWADRPLVVL